MYGSGSGKRKRKQLMADLRKRKQRKNWPLFHHCYQGRTSHSCLLCRFPSHLFDRPDLLASWQFITGQLKNFEMKVLTLEEPGVYILPRNWVVFHRSFLSEGVVFHYYATYLKYLILKRSELFSPINIIYRAFKYICSWIGALFSIGFIAKLLQNFLIACIIGKVYYTPLINSQSVASPSL